MADNDADVVSGGRECVLRCSGEVYTAAWGARDGDVIFTATPMYHISGYWRQPAATAASWRSLWHHTGDLGRLDEDGFL